MKIGFDAKRAALNFTGLGNYSRDLIRIMLTHVPEHKYYCYSPGFPQNPRTDFLRTYDNIVMRTPAKPLHRLVKSYWRSFGIMHQIDKDGLDLYHGLSQELPFGIRKHTCKSVVTIHDLIFMRLPQTYSAVDRQVYKYKAAYACRNADRIIAISRQTKVDIIDFFDIDEDKIDVVYQACHPQFRSKTSAEDLRLVRERYCLPECFILSVGTIEKRKNQLNTVRAFALLDKSDDISLVIIGRKTDYYRKVVHEIEVLGITDRVKFIDNISFTDLPAIYKLSEAFVYPSQFEGFGIPILEALYSGIPVITSRGGCFAEAGGPGSLYVNQEEPEDIKDAIETVLNDKLLHNKMVEEGYLHAAQFSEKAVAEGLMNVYRKTING